MRAAEVTISLSKVLKSMYTNVSERRQIHTIPIVRIVTPTSTGNAGFLSGESEGVAGTAGNLQSEPPTPEEIVQGAMDEAESLLSDAHDQAEKLVTDANQQAEQVIAEAERKVQQMLEEAQQSGYQAGLEEGKAFADDFYRDKIDESLAMIQQSELERKRLILQAEQDILQLSVSIAQKIIGRELEIGSEWVVQTVKSALSEMVDLNRIEIMANPEDIPILLHNKRELLSGFTARVDLQFVSEPSIEKGGCIIQTSQGTIDAQVETQLNEVKRALFEMSAGLTQ